MERTYPLSSVFDWVRGAYFHDARGRTMMKMPSQTAATIMTGTRVERSDEAEFEFSSALEAEPMFWSLD